MKCGKCEVDYPTDLLSEMFVADKSGNGYTRPVCGICALEITNASVPKKFHRREFLGVQAESMRLQAIEHRKKTNQNAKSE
jgi:hypothetical protein